MVTESKLQRFRHEESIFDPVLDKTPQATLLIALTLTVVLHQFRVLLAALFLIIGMLVPPLLLAFQHDLVILGVRREFLAVIIGAALALTLG